MPAFHSSTIGRRAVTAATAAFMMTVAACSDETTAPRSTIAVPDGANAMNLPARSLVTVQIKNIWGGLLSETAKVKFVTASDSGEIQDNSAADKNATVGIITVYLPWSATYKACLTQDTKSFAVDMTKPYCNTVPGNAKSVDAGSLVMRQFPVAGFFMQDSFGASIPGGQITLTAPPSDGFQATASDVNGIDLSLTNDGKIVFKANRPGTYSWCENIAPSGFFLTSPQCGTIDLHWDVSTGLTLKHKKKLIVINPF